VFARLEISRHRFKLKLALLNERRIQLLHREGTLFLSEIFEYICLSYLLISLKPKLPLSCLVYEYDLPCHFCHTDEVGAILHHFHQHQHLRILFVPLCIVDNHTEQTVVCAVFFQQWPGIYCGVEL